MNRNILVLLFAFLSSFCVMAKEAPALRGEKIPTVFVDEAGVLRWSDTKEEASFYGVNYTLPFAHAYRTMGKLGVDRKTAIDRDVYHMARLGFNAYRIHIWDVEISDAEGNLIENDHLELLDYLIQKLRERGIRVFITAQTNFGNGYPEKNINTGAFSYKYDRAHIHTQPEAIAAQQKYIAALVNHVNKYTKNAYKDEPYIVGFEINNEPFHPGTAAQTEEYINTMLQAMKDAGNTKPVFYNVSHNLDVTQAYFNTNVQGTTYQWYPIGLVSGHIRTGNFLPYVDNYAIPFSNLEGFANKARFVYEFDPADILYSYMYPAIARSFRAKGFQWITQFAYDPIDMAYCNTEYQTHFLNLAYTPNKAVSMAIAAEVARNVKRGETFGTYPQDTTFSSAKVSYLQDLSIWNSGDKFYYSNSTEENPSDVERLESIIGYGNSSLVQYDGTGVYFLDKLESGVWRLEVMPDAITVRDPFAKPAPSKEVVAIKSGAWDMSIGLPDLGIEYSVRAINDGNNASQEAHNCIIKSLTPGVYILAADKKAGARWTKSTKWKNITLGEYVMPKADRTNEYYLVNNTISHLDREAGLTIQAEIVGPAKPDSVIIYTDRVSFWNEKNPSYRMTFSHAYKYYCELPDSLLKGNELNYNIIVCTGKDRITFPGAVKGTPLDWDYISNDYFHVNLYSQNDPVVLVENSDWHNGLEHYTLPDNSDNNYYQKNIIDLVKGRKGSLKNASALMIEVAKPLPAGMTIDAGFVTSNGFTYKAVASPCGGNLFKVEFRNMLQDKTALLPHPYPVFLDSYFEPKVKLPFAKTEVEKLEISNKGERIAIEKAWLE